MKKLSLILVMCLIAITPVINFAQYDLVSGLAAPNTCLQNLINTVYNCLAGIGVTGQIVESDNQLHLYCHYASSEPNIRGRIQKCVSDYNGDRNECEDAPVMVVKNN